LSKKKLAGIIVACIIGIFIVIAIAVPSEPTSPPPTTPSPTTSETISTPSTPSGSSTGIVNESLTYITGGSTSSLEHSVQYRFNWGDGNYSEWSSSTSATHSWSSPGKYMIQAQGRSSADASIFSSWSGSKSVTINPTPTATPTPSPPSPTKQIIIKYSATTMTQIGSWDKADEGYTYLVLDLDIENDGYDSFSTNPFYFCVIVNNVKYDSAFVFELEDELKLVDLLDGGRVSGKLAFEVPEEVTSLGYQVKYESWEEYNIKWIER